MIYLGWDSAFSSSPTAMAVARAGGGGVAPSQNTPLRHEMSVLERRASTLCIFTSFQKALDLPDDPQPVTKDKATAKVATLAVSRDLERNAKIGSGRGLTSFHGRRLWVIFPTHFSFEV